jgi:large subunit ribosomal protein L1
MKRAKGYLSKKEQIEKGKLYEVDEAVALVIQIASRSLMRRLKCIFATVLIPVMLTKQVRGAIVLPHGTEKRLERWCLPKGEKAKEAEAAGADFVGAEELAEKIQKENWMDFDAVIATPDMMVL